MAAGAGSARASPEVSIIVPVYNVAGYVGACLQSLRAQTFTDFEVIVVDDGSTDGSTGEIWAAVGNDPRFHVLTQPNGGLSAARNAGMDMAQGRIIGFVDSDDRVAPEFIAVLHAALAASGAAWVASAIRYVWADGKQHNHSAIHGTPFPAGPGTGVTQFRFENWMDVVPHFPSAWNKIYRRELLDGVRFDVGTYFEDHPFFCDLAGRTDRLAYVGQPLYWQTQGRTGQITGEDSDRVFEQFAVLDRVAQIMQGTDRPGAGRALSTVATRLTYERSNVIKDEERRARFTAACRAYFRTRGLSVSTDLKTGISPLWTTMLQGRLPLSIVVPVDRVDDALDTTVASLKAEALEDVEVLFSMRRDDPALRRSLLQLAATLPRGSVLSAADEGLVPALQRAVAAAIGDVVLILMPGSEICPTRIQPALERMSREGARIAISEALEMPSQSDPDDRSGRPMGSPEIPLFPELWSRHLLADLVEDLPTPPLEAAAALLAAQVGESRKVAVDAAVTAADPQGDSAAWLEPEPDADAIAAAVHKATLHPARRVAVFDRLIAATLKLPAMSEPNRRSAFLAVAQKARVALVDDSRENLVPSVPDTTSGDGS